jgi:hypothetical protein
MGQRRPDALVKRPAGEIMTNDDGDLAPRA